MAKTIPITPEEIKALNERKKEISSRCESFMKDNIEQILAYISGQSQPNGFFEGLYKSVEEENRKIYSRPEQGLLLQMTNSYALGLIDRIKESLYMNSKNPQFVEFVERHGSLPKIGELFSESMENQQ